MNKIFKVFKEADIKAKIAIIISCSMFVLANVNIFMSNEKIRTIIWVGVVISLVLDFLFELQLCQEVEKKLFEEQKRRINLLYDLRSLKIRIEIEGLNKVQTGKELDQIIDRCLND